MYFLLHYYIMHQQCAPRLIHNGTKPTHTEMDTASSMKPNSSAQNIPVEETPLIATGITGMCQCMYKWGQVNAVLQSADNCQCSSRSAHGARSYWDNQFGQAGNSNLASAAL